jgi:hypothetical protein
MLIAEGVPRTAALEAYSKASQTAYWTKVKLSSNTFEVVEYLKSIGIGDELPEVRACLPASLPRLMQRGGSMQCASLRAGLGSERSCICWYRAVPGTPSAAV